MPAKSRKTADKESIWQKLRDVDIENLHQCHVEYVYKLQHELTCCLVSNNKGDSYTCARESRINASGHHSSMAKSSSQQPFVQLERTRLPNSHIHIGDPENCNSASPSTTNGERNCDTDKPNDLLNGVSKNATSLHSESNRNVMPFKSDLSGAEQVTGTSSTSQLHKNCRRNCVSDPFCVAGLGFEKWFAGDMDYDWPSDDEDDDCLVKRKKDIPVGLVNLGATCYVNAFLQLWYHNLAFRNAVFEWGPDTDDGFSICDSLQYIFGLLELSHRSCVDPSSLIHVLGLDASLQQDAQEFSKLFVDLLPYPQVKSMFSGSYDYVTRCSTCKQESRTLSQFNELDLSIESLNTLDDCLKSFLKIEKLTGDNQYFCSKCQSKQDAKRRIQLRNLPPVLNIQLLRFVFDRKTGHKKKLNTCLQFPDHLDLTSLVASNGEQHQYELTAVLMHSGVSAFSGHYTAHIRKLDHWFSFNDANVVKLKGKKLNLANEESLDYNPDATASASNEGRKKGNRSKNAYMLVYQNKAFIQSTKDLQPSPVPENIKQRVEEDNEKLNFSNQDAEIKQTEQMVRVDMKKDQVKELWNGLEVPVDSRENYYMLPVSWLTDSLKDWGDLDLIDTRPLLCRHNKLNWTLHSKYKIVSQQKGEFIYKTYAGKDTVVLNRDNSLCYDCVRNQLIWRRQKERTETDSKKISSLISTNTSNATSSVQYWVSKSELRWWRSLVLKPLEKDAQPTLKSANDDNEEKSEMNGIDKAGSSIGSNLATADSQSACTNGPTTSNGIHSSDSSPNELLMDDTDDRFNSEILCEHGELATTEKVRQLVPQAAWDILLHYFPDAVTVTSQQPICAKCMGDQEKMAKIEEQRKVMVREQRQVLSDLSALRNRPIIDCLVTDTIYCMSHTSYKQWKQFLRNPTTLSGIETIENDSVICPHSKLCVYPSNDNSIVLLWPYEWDLISSHFPCDVIIQVKARKDHTTDNHSTDNIPYLTIPDICTECVQSRLISEELESHVFDNARIYIRLLDNDSKDDADKDKNGKSNHSASVNTSTTEDDEVPPESKKAKLEHPSEDILHTIPLAVPTLQRRSGRRKHVRGDKSLKVSSSLKLKELRVELVKLFAIAPFDQILSLDGRKLEGDDKSLAELKLYPDCLLLLKGDIYDDGNLEQAILHQGLMEEGFRGTGLLANTDDMRDKNSIQ